jgi:hypothetical protein
MAFHLVYNKLNTKFEKLWYHKFELREVDLNLEGPI